MSRRYLVAFAIGFTLVGAFDWAYTYVGGQTYSQAARFLTLGDWPMYVPFQMGAAAIGLLHLWTKVERAIVRAGLPRESSAHGIAGMALPLLCLTLTLAATFPLLHHPQHLSIFVALLMLSLVILGLWGGRYELLAFAFIGALGGGIEWLLLSPSANYWTFAHHELFGRLPAWEPVIYGWIGVSIRRLSVS